MAYPLKQSNFEIESRTILSNFGYTVLAPIVRMFMRFGYSARDFNDLARWVYVRVFYTTPDFWRFGRPTALQGAIKTGIPRSIVKQIREIPEPQQILFTQRQNIAYRVIEGWVNDPEFHVDGNASVLPLHSRSGPSFRALANKYGNDVTLGSVVGDLADVGCIQVQDGMVTLVNQTYGMNFLDEDLLGVVGYASRRLGETIDHNVVNKEKETKRLQRVWLNSRIPADQLDVALKMIEKEAVEAGRRIDRLLSEMSAHGNNAAKTVEVGVGMYSYASEEKYDA